MLDKTQICSYLGQKVKKLRKVNGMTQKVLAEKMGFNLRYITQLESGKYWSSVETLLNLCHVFNVTPNFFFEDFIGDIDDFHDISLNFSTLDNDDKETVKKFILFLSDNKSSKK